MEKNILIEREYINLKYQHNREIKDLKRNITFKILKEVDKHIQEFNLTVKDEKINELLKNKIDKFTENLKNMSNLASTSKKFAKNHSKRTLELCEEQSRHSTLSEKH